VLRRVEQTDHSGLNEVVDFTFGGIRLTKW